jgi:hypothetical protein
MIRILGPSSVRKSFFYLFLYLNIRVYLAVYIVDILLVVMRKKRYQPLMWLLERVRHIH